LSQWIYNELGASLAISLGPVADAGADANTRSKKQEVKIGKERPELL